MLVQAIKSRFLRNKVHSSSFNLELMITFDYLELMTTFDYLELMTTFES